MKDYWVKHITAKIKKIKKSHLSKDIFVINFYIENFYLIKLKKNEKNKSLLVFCRLFEKECPVLWRFYRRFFHLSRNKMYSGKFFVITKAWTSRSPGKSKNYWIITNSYDFLIVAHRALTRAILRNITPVQNQHGRVESRIHFRYCTLPADTSQQMISGNS